MPPEPSTEIRTGLADDYTVRLEGFHGPLDLLLFLIRRAEVDITDIPISDITEQYMTFLRHLDRIDVEAAGEFLVVAATLMEIKSRMLMPPEPQAGDEDGDESAATHESEVPVDGLDRTDPRFELVQQLLAYKRFREAARELDERRHEWMMRLPLEPVAIPKAVAGDDDDGEDGAAIETDLEDLAIWDLFSAFQRIIEAIDFTRVGAHRVEYDDTPIQLHQEDLVDRLQRQPARRMSLQKVFEGRKRGEMIGLFLAMLELVREWRIRVAQDRINDEILILLREDDAEADHASPDTVVVRLPEDSNDADRDDTPVN